MHFALHIFGTGYLLRIFSQGKRARFVQPTSKAETNITDAKEDYSYQEKQNYQQEVNTSQNHHIIIFDSQMGS